MLDRADCADFGCHNSIRLETKHFLNTLALTFISFSGRFVFAVQKHYLFFFASDPLVVFGLLYYVSVFIYNIYGCGWYIRRFHLNILFKCQKIFHFSQKYHVKSSVCLLKTPKRVAQS